MHSSDNENFSSKIDFFSFSYNKLRDTLSPILTYKLEMQHTFFFDDINLETLLSYQSKWEKHWRAFTPDFSCMTEYNTKLDELITHYWIFKIPRSKILDYIKLLTNAFQSSSVTNIINNTILATLSTSFFRLILSFILVSTLWIFIFCPVSLEPLLQLLYCILSLLFTNSSAVTGTRAKE